MIDTSSFEQDVEHAVRDGLRESADFSAIKIDNTDGLAKHLGFNSSMLSLVDYYCYSNQIIQFIELTDLEDSISECRSKCDEEIEKAVCDSTIRLTQSEIRKIRRKIWKPVLLEFKSKWCGSIAVIERLYRKNNIIEDNPDYELLIICKNSTDILMLDILKTQLSGMMGNVKVCNSATAKQFIVSLPN